jgi:2-dehydro-3-deoxyglucarate aldolase/4-hydroxy-2-oxoheptanedioate aldolase
MSIQDRMADQNENRMLFIQLESPKAVANADAIIDAADGYLNGVFMGPADFQVAIGKPDQPECAELDEAVRKVSAVCAERGISNGVPVGTLTAARWWLDRGFTLITFANDDAFLANTAAEARSALADLEREIASP